MRVCYPVGMNLRSSVVLVVLLGGCGPQTTDTGPTTEAGSASTAAGSSSTDAPTTGSPTTGSPTTGEPTTGGSGCVPGPVAGEVTCQPPGKTQAYWSLSFAYDPWSADALIVFTPEG
jgi:hypothetical protein